MKTKTRAEQDPLNAVIGRNIKRIRRANEFSQAQLGGLFRPPIRLQQVQKIENGKNRVSASGLYRIKEEFGCQLEEFFEE